jgi:hypothetical protein
VKTPGIMIVCLLMGGDASHVPAGPAPHERPAPPSWASPWPNLWSKSWPTPWSSTWAAPRRPDRETVDAILEGPDAAAARHYRPLDDWREALKGGDDPHEIDIAYFLGLGDRQDPALSFRLLAEGIFRPGASGAGTSRRLELCRSSIGDEADRGEDLHRAEVRSRVSRLTPEVRASFRRHFNSIRPSLEREVLALYRSGRLAGDAAIEFAGPVSDRPCYPILAIALGQGLGQAADRFWEDRVVGPGLVDVINDDRLRDLSRDEWRDFLTGLERRGLASRDDLREAHRRLVADLTSSHPELASLSQGRLHAKLGLAGPEHSLVSDLVTLAQPDGRRQILRRIERGKSPR